MDPAKINILRMKWIKIFEEVFEYARVNQGVHPNESNDVCLDTFVHIAAYQRTRKLRKLM